MKSSVEQLNEVQRRVKVEVPADEVNRAFDNAYRNLQKKAKIQGFRPGKAPLGIIRKLYGSNVSVEVGEKLINAHLFTAIQEQTIRPVASPVLETNAVPVQDQEYVFSAIVDIMPVLQFDDYKGLTVSVEKYEITDEIVDQEIYRSRRQKAVTKPLEEGAEAAQGHLAVISHKAYIDDRPLEEMTVENMSVALGQDELYEGLEQAVYGMKTGEVKRTTITLPNDYGDEDLAGKDVEFEITLSDLKQLDIPAFDDEFAKDLDFEDAAAFKNNVREQLQRRAEDMHRQKIENSLLDQILQKHPFEVPPAMVDQVIDSMISEQFSQLSEDEQRKVLNNEELRKHFRDGARRRTQNTLILWHISQKENLEPADEEVEERLSKTLEPFGLSDPKQTSQLRKNLEPRIRENLLFEKAMNFLIENASVTETPASI